MKTILLTLAVCLHLVSPLSGAELSDDQVLAILEAEDPRDDAIDRGLAWLREQQRDDGSLATDKYRTAITALAVMAHLAAGITYTDPEHGEWLLRSTRFLLTMQEPGGYFGDKDDSRMYGHGITTLALAEALGMVEDPTTEEAIRSAVERAVARTVWAATEVEKKKGHEGGWRYHPHSNDSDLSLSGWQLMGLHAAQQVGITVPEEVVTNAVAYARRLTTDDGKVGYDKRGEDHEALRGLGMLAFAVVRHDNDELVDAIAQRIERDPIEWKGSWFYYRVYYDAVGMARARPEAWERYQDVLEPVLLEHQDPEGFWGAPPGDNEAGRFGKVYSTSMAVLALAVDRHVLPAYQR